MPKMSIYQRILNEIFAITVLFPEFQIYTFCKEEDVDIADMQDLYTSLKHYREQLELNNHVFCDDEETEALIREGIRIYSVLIKEQFYGES